MKTWSRMRQGAGSEWKSLTCTRYERGTTDQVQGRNELVIEQGGGIGRWLFTITKWGVEVEECGKISREGSYGRGKNVRGGSRSLAWVEINNWEYGSATGGAASSAQEKQRHEPSGPSERSYSIQYCKTSAWMD